MHLLDKKGLAEHVFQIDSEYEDDILQGLKATFKQSQNVSRELNTLFEKFEDILMKSNDYANYDEKAKDVVDKLQFMYRTLSDALLALNPMLDSDGDLSPRAQRRIYMKGINDMQEAIAKTAQRLPQIQNNTGNKDTIPQKRLAENPFMGEIEG